MSVPKVSVVIPTFNRCELVQLAIDSVLSQTFQDLEIIVVDDGSTDGTDQALQKYGSQIKYVFQDNAGESVAREQGVALSSGEYIAFLDSDDIWLPEKLARQIDVLITHPRVGFVYCWAYMIDSRGSHLPRPPLGYGLNPSVMTLGQLLENNYIVAPGSSLVIRREVYDAAHGYDQMIQFAEDWDLCLRLAVRHEFACVAIPLVEVRLHTRGWLQKRDNLERMLDDHLRIIDNFIQYLPAPTDELMRSATNSKANRYARVAFEHLAYGQTREGRERLEKACLLAPSAWANRDLFAQRAAEFATLLTYNGDEKTALAFIERTTASLPEPLRRAGVTRSLMLAHAHKVLADHYKLQANPGAVRRNAIRAVWQDPKWLLHRGVRSLLFRSLMGNVRAETDWPSHVPASPGISLIDIRAIRNPVLEHSSVDDTAGSVTTTTTERVHA